MNRLAAAFRIFFRTLTDASAAAQVEQVLTGKGLPAPTVSEAPRPSPSAAPRPAPPPPAPVQNAGITLLAALQRESRLVDFLMEDLAAYSDDQIGAAVREVQRDAAKALNRMFDLHPIHAGDEGSPVELTTAQVAERYRLTGNVSAADTVRGTLQHHGWEARRCDLPTYTGSPAAASLVAPAEVEVT